MNHLSMTWVSFDYPMKINLTRIHESLAKSFMNLKKLVSSFKFSILLRILVKLLQFSSSFLTFVLVARFLGPESFGKLSFASALVALFMPIAGFDLLTVFEPYLLITLPS